MLVWAVVDAVVRALKDGGEGCARYELGPSILVDTIYAL